MALRESRKWLEVKRAYDYRCIYCGEIQENAFYLTVDHLIPKSKGGKSELWNIVPACHQCNAKKRAISFADFVRKHCFPQEVSDRWLAAQRALTDYFSQLTSYEVYAAKAGASFVGALKSIMEINHE